MRNLSIAGLQSRKLYQTLRLSRYKLTFNASFVKGMIMRSFMAMTLVLIVACVQVPSDVVLKGENIYTKNQTTSLKNNQYSKRVPAPVQYSEPPVQAVTYQPVIVSDLPISGRVANDPSYQQHVYRDHNYSYQPQPVYTQPSAYDNYTYKTQNAPFRQILAEIPSNQFANKAKTSSLIYAPEEHRALAKQNPSTESFIRVKEEVTEPSFAISNIKPTTKPKAPQWYAQKAKTRVTEGFIWPVRGKLISTFGSKYNGLQNDGINIATSAGKLVRAAADGEVVYAGNELPAYGNMVIVRHNNGWLSAYAHLKTFAVGVGGLVNQGQSLGLVGKTGDVKTAQLHFGLRKDKKAVNPLDFLNEKVAAR